MTNEDVDKRAARIKLLLMDCDGVLTDGRIALTTDGDEQKTFHVRDGQGIVLLHRVGIITGIISGRRSNLVERRAEELGIRFVEQGIRNKVESLNSILNQVNVSTEAVAYIGDDIADINIMAQVGLAIAVADAAIETKNAAHHITNLNGGTGAVREVAELILKSQQKWNYLLNNYLN